MTVVRIGDSAISDRPNEAAGLLSNNTNTNSRPFQRNGNSGVRILLLYLPPQVEISSTFSPLSCTRLPNLRLEELNFGLEEGLVWGGWPEEGYRSGDQSPTSSALGSNLDNRNARGSESRSGSSSDSESTSSSSSSSSLSSSSSSNESWTTEGEYQFHKFAEDEDELFTPLQMPFRHPGYIEDESVEDGDMGYEGDSESVSCSDSDSDSDESEDGNSLDWMFDGGPMIAPY